MKTVVVGASSGLGRCIGIGLAQRGGQLALLARRRGNLETAASEAGGGTHPFSSFFPKFVGILGILERG